MNIGLSLSGGAAKGLVHLGVISELEKTGVKVDMLAGCSIGALIGAMYAVEPDIELVKTRLFDFLDEHADDLIPVAAVNFDESEERRSLLRKVANSIRKSIYYGVSLAKVSYLSIDDLRNNISLLLPDIGIEDLKIPFTCSATDITNYRDVHFTKGSLIDAVVASCALPGVYPPVEVDGALLVDGGWASNNQISKLLEMGADFIVASNIRIDFNNSEIANGLDVVIRSNNATRHILSELDLASADIVVEPEVCIVNWWDFASARDCLGLGAKKAAEDLAGIGGKIWRKRLKLFLHAA